MKIVTLIARLLLGLMFLVFGLNGIHPFMPSPPLPGGLAGQFVGALMGSHYTIFVASLQVVSAVLFLVNRYIPLALTLIGPVIVNIILFHALMFPAGIQMGILAAICWLIVFWRVRSAFAGIFQAKVQS